MSLVFVECAPRELVTFAPGEPELSPEDVRHVAELFRTPLTGSYTWDYHEADQRLRKLYSLGKERNWNADLDVDWSIAVPRNEAPVVENFNPFEGWAPFEALDTSALLRKQGGAATVALRPRP